MIRWETVIGLEVHVQLATQTKLFCACRAEFGDVPNTNVCPVCLGLPGALPVTNEQAVRLAVRAGVAFGSTVNAVSEFARKSYFYPDLPKGYQISQFEHPLIAGGQLTIDDGSTTRTVRFNRMHLEEDAGKSIHDRFEGETALDFNRAGVPLVEIVTEPDLRSPAEARAFLNELKHILEFLAVSDCNMEEGHLRVDGNLSVRQVGQQVLGTKQEVKNMNSFAGVERALTALRDQQIAMLEQGQAVEQSTYSAATGTLTLMRSKEDSRDYRYFPDPDLPPLCVPKAWIEVTHHEVGELPRAMSKRFVEQYGVTVADAAVLVIRREVATFFETLIRADVPVREAVNWVTGPVLHDANLHGGVLRIGPSRLAELIGMVRANVLSVQAAKKVYARLADTDESPQDVAQRLGLIQVDDMAKVADWVQSVTTQFPDEFKRYRDGDTRLSGFFIGRAIKASGGKADPGAVRQVVESLLTSD